MRKTVYTCDSPYCGEIFDTEEECNKHMSRCQLLNSTVITKYTFDYSIFSGAVDMYTDTCHGYVWNGSYFDVSNGDAYICGAGDIDVWKDPDEPPVWTHLRLRYCTFGTLTSDRLIEIKKEAVDRITHRLNALRDHVNKVAVEVKIK